MSKTEKKELIKLIGVVILLLALPLTIYLTKHTQIFKPKAFDEESRIEFTGNIDRSGAIPATVNQTVGLQLTYSPGSPGSPGQPTTLCQINLTEGQTINGNLSFILAGNRANPSYYLSLNVINSRQGNFQVLSSQTNILFATVSSAALFQNGPGAFECRIQEEPGGGTIISSSRVNVNVSN